MSPSPRVLLPILGLHAFALGCGASLHVRTVSRPPSTDDAKPADPGAPNPPGPPSPAPVVVTPPSPLPPAPVVPEVPPVVVAPRLTVTTGVAVASNSITIGFGTSPAFDSVEIRREPGTTSPDCSTGTIVRVFAKPFVQSASFSDQTETANGEYAYRACYVGSTETLASAETPVAKTKPHLLFVSTPNLRGDLLGVSGASEVCSSTASATNTPLLRGETTWQAVLSDSDVDARARVRVLGQVASTDYSEAQPYRELAADASSLWSSGLATGGSSGVLDATAHDSQSLVWSGSTGNGNKTADHCNNWTSTVGDGSVGDATTLSGNAWLNGGGTSACSEERAVYCISQPKPMIVGLTGQTQANSIDLTLTPTEQWTSEGFVEVRRRPFPGIPSADCTSALDTPILSLHPLTPDVTKFTDNQAAATQAYNYRVCLFDKSGSFVFSSLIQHIVTSA